MLWCKRSTQLSFSRPAGPHALLVRDTQGHCPGSIQPNTGCSSFETYSKCSSNGCSPCGCVLGCIVVSFVHAHVWSSGRQAREGALTLEMHPRWSNKYNLMIYSKFETSHRGTQIQCESCAQSMVHCGNTCRLIVKGIRSKLYIYASIIVFHVRAPMRLVAPPKCRCRAQVRTRGRRLCHGAPTITAGRVVAY
jgi:hypothetical protein